jgi:hypothetical protein
VPSQPFTVISADSTQAEEDVYLTQSQDTDEEEEGFDVIQDCVPIRFLENRIRTLSRTSVPHDLHRLAQHKENMGTFIAGKDWKKLNLEQINASRTVQVREEGRKGGEGLTTNLDPQVCKFKPSFLERLKVYQLWPQIVSCSLFRVRMNFLVSFPHPPSNYGATCRH